MRWLIFIPQGLDIYVILWMEENEKTGWSPQSAYERLEKTIDWTLKNDRWLKI